MIAVLTNVMTLSMIIMTVTMVSVCIKINVGIISLCLLFVVLPQSLLQKLTTLLAKGHLL